MRDWKRLFRTRGNPLRFWDRGGHREEGREGPPPAEPARPLAERARWDAEFSQQIEGWTAACWEETAPLRELLWEAGVTLRAGERKWTLVQAEAVGEAVRRIADRFEGDARPIVGGVTVVLRTKTEPWWAPLWRWRHRKPATYRFGAYENRGVIHTKPATLQVGAILHEMGHYCDERGRLSRGYRKRVKGAGLEMETNRFEDFANAFRDYVLGRPQAGVRRDYFERLRRSSHHGGTENTAS